MSNEASQPTPKPLSGPAVTSLIAAALGALVATVYPPTAIALAVVALIFATIGIGHTGSSGTRRGRGVAGAGLALGLISLAVGISMALG